MIEDVKRGHTSSYDPLITYYQDQIYHLVLRKMGNEHDALEICQDVFLKGFNKIELFRGNSRFGTWLYSIAINECRSRFRSNATKPKSTSLELASENSEDSTTSEVEQGETQVAVREAIRQLADDYAIPLILFHFQGKAHKEISEILRIPVGTVKTRIHRGHKLLVEKLKTSSRLAGML